jgi:2-phosphoglycerate kinase
MKVQKKNSFINKTNINDENENKNQFLKRIKKNKHKPG